MRPPREFQRWNLKVNYQPHAGQLAFHKDRGKVVERFLCAGTRAGKTYGAGFEVFDITLRERSDLFLVAAPDYPQLELSIYPNLKQLFGRPLTELEPYATFNQTKRRLEWWNGWEWRFVSMDDPTSVEGVPECAGVWLTEARLVAKFGGEDGAWSNLTRRLGGREARARHAILDTHSATRQIVAELDEVAVQRFTLNGGSFGVHQGRDPMRRMYQWGTMDAITWGTLDRAAGERIVARYAKSPTAAKRILAGLHAVPSGVVWDSYDPTRHLQAPPPGYRFEWFSGGIDWGWTEEHPCALVLWGHTGSTSWILGEDSGPYWSLATIKARCEALAAKWALHREDGVHAPPDVKWHGGHDKPEQAAALAALGLDVDTYSGRVEDGIEVLNRRTAADEIRVHPDCKGVRHDQENYVRGTDGKPDKDQYDPHHIDAARYGLLGGKAPETAGVLRPSNRRR